MGERRGAVVAKRQVVDVTKPPVLARLVGLDDGMVLGPEVGSGVAIRRAVAAADVPAGHAHPQVHPPAAHAQTVLAAIARWGHLGHRVEMGTGCSHVRSLLAWWYTPA